MERPDCRGVQKKRKDISVDSSGLGVRQFVRWSTSKNRRGERRNFRKLHLAVEARGPEKVIYNAEVTTATRHDSPLFKPLLRRISGPLGIVSGDKAYSCRKNAQYTHRRGGTPRLMPKMNATAQAKGKPAWTRMIRERQRNPEQWDREYHQRSNSESVNWSFKKRQGPCLYSRGKHRQKLEVYLKVLVYNLRLLIRRNVRVALT